MNRDRNGSVINLDDGARARPASEVLADVDWDGKRVSPDPSRLTAVEYLAWLTETTRGGTTQ